MANNHVLRSLAQSGTIDDTPKRSLGIINVHFHKSHASDISEVDGILKQCQVEWHWNEQSRLHDDTPERKQTKIIWFSRISSDEPKSGKKCF